MKELLKLITKQKTEEDLKNLLQDLCSEKELDQIQTRIKIIRMLKQGKPQHEIAKELKIGVATVTRGAKMLKEGRFEYVD